MIEESGGVVHWLVAQDGVRVRAAHWPEGARGTVLLLNGRTEFIEKYAETVAALQARGFSVWTLDWRGQGRSARLHPDPVAHHVGRFEDYIADAEGVLERIEGTVVLLAHSMGGHIGARLLARHPGRFARAVLSAPMIDFLHGRVPRWATRVIAGVASLRGANRFGPGPPRLPVLDRPFDGNPLTSCAERYAAGFALVRADPALAIGGVTWGWLRAATASVAVLHRASTVRRIGLPVLVLTAGDERFVDNRAVVRFAARLARAELVHFAGSRHELLGERDDIRDPVWAVIDAFLAPVE